MMFFDSVTTLSLTTDRECKACFVSSSDVSDNVLTPDDSVMFVGKHSVETLVPVKDAILHVFLNMTEVIVVISVSLRIST